MTLRGKKKSWNVVLNHPKDIFFKLNVLRDDYFVTDVIVVSNEPEVGFKVCQLMLQT